MAHMRAWSQVIEPVKEESDSENEIIIEPEDFKIVPEKTDPHWQPWESEEKMKKRIDTIRETLKSEGYVGFAVFWGMCGLCASSEAKRIDSVWLW